VGILFGFAPWIVYWLLVGNVPFHTAVLVALVTALAAFAVGRLTGSPGRTLETGSAVAFVVLTVLTFTASEDFMHEWIQSLSSLLVFLVALGSVLAGRPFVREYAVATVPPDIAETELFKTITARLTWIWVAAFGGMAVSSAIPPIVQPEATLLDERTPLSFICYWVVPMSLLALAALATRVLPDRMVARADEIVRQTTFVAPEEATIDELYYLAREHALREVGPGKEPYEIKVGAKGTPLVGDDGRMSWPSTYKVRDARR